MGVSLGLRRRVAAMGCPWWCGGERETVGTIRVRSLSVGKSSLILCQFRHWQCGARGVAVAIRSNLCATMNLLVFLSFQYLLKT